MNKDEGSKAPSWFKTKRVEKITKKIDTILDKNTKNKETKKRRRKAGLKQDKKYGRKSEFEFK